MLMNLLTNAESQLATVLSGLIVVGLVGIGHIVMRKIQCIDIINNRSLRQSHAFILVAQAIDRLHEKEKPGLEQIVEKALKDENGKL